MKEIVIKIPDNMLDVIKNSENTTWLAVTYGNQLVWQVKNGKVLPKGHGELRDTTTIVDKITDADIYLTNDEWHKIGKALQSAEVLVEADKGGDK